MITHTIWILKILIIMILIKSKNCFRLFKVYVVLKKHNEQEFISSVDAKYQNRSRGIEVVLFFILELNIPKS